MNKTSSKAPLWMVRGVSWINCGRGIFQEICSNSWKVLLAEKRGDEEQMMRKGEKIAMYVFREGMKQELNAIAVGIVFRYSRLLGEPPNWRFFPFFQIAEEIYPILRTVFVSQSHIFPPYQLHHSSSSVCFYSFFHNSFESFFKTFALSLQEMKNIKRKRNLLYDV